MSDDELVPVVAYARASHDRARDEHTVSSQQRINQATAQRLGCRIVASFTDNDKSAAKEEVYRDDFERMLKVLRAGRLRDGTVVCGAIVAAEDRLVRRAGDYERFVDALTVREGRVFADKRGFQDLYSENVENMGLMGAVASRIEVKKIRRRVRDWHRSRALSGAVPHGLRPFGWQDDKKTLDPVESSLLRTAIDEVLSGRTMNSVVQEWNRRGVATSRGNRWQAQTLKKLLKNSRICGLRSINDELVRDEDGNPVQGDWEPLVSVEKWQALRAFFDARAGKVATREGLCPLPIDHSEHRYLLTGYVICGRSTDDGSICGCRLRASRLPHIKSHIYGCKPRAEGGCSGVGRHGGKVDEFISEAVLSRLEQRTTEPRETGPWPRAKELSDTEEQLRLLRWNWHNQVVSNELFFADAQVLETRIKELRAERDHHALRQSQQTRDMEDIRRRWYTPVEEGGYDISQKRALVGRVLHAVIVHPAGRGNGRLHYFNPDLLEPVWRE